MLPFKSHFALLADGSPTDPPLAPAVPAAAPSAAEVSREDLKRLVDLLPQSTLNTVGRLLELLTRKA